jgi:hypothetical protein
MSINAEVIAGTPMVQRYVEEIGRPDHLRLVSNSRGNGVRSCFLLNWDHGTRRKEKGKKQDLTLGVLLRIIP